MSRDVRFAGYIHRYESWPGTIFGLILKNKMVTMGISLMVIQEFYTFGGFFLVYGKLNAFMVDIFNKYISCIAYRYLTLMLTSFSRKKMSTIGIFMMVSSG